MQFNLGHLTSRALNSHSVLHNPTRK